MMKRLLVGAGVLLVLGLASVSFAQDHHRVSRTVISFSEPVIVGTTTLNPGRYRFECKEIEGQHVMIITRTDTMKEVARVRCTPVALESKVLESGYRSTLREDGRILTEIRIKGESIGHKFPVSN